MLQILRESAAIIVAFSLGVALTLAILFGTGGVYEYRVVGRAEMVDLINDEHWEIVPGRDAVPGAYYLRRPRLRLP